MTDRTADLLVNLGLAILLLPAAVALVALIIAGFRASTGAA